MRYKTIILFLVALTSGFAKEVRPGATLSYRELITRGPSSLDAKINSVNPVTGAVTLLGGDSRRPTTPFDVNWGDGKSSEGFFPLAHTYRDRTRNYVVSITASYGDWSYSTVTCSVRFAPVILSSKPSTVETTVAIPETLPAIESTVAEHGIPAVEPFADSAFQLCSREVFGRVMNAFAAIQLDLVNRDVASIDGPFRQIIMGQSESSDHYAFSIWFTRPAMFVAKPSLIRGTPDWSSIAHEMGHNMTLNSPASNRLGVGVEGPANAIVSEALAQIFQHATCFELVNHSAEYGIPEEIVQEIAQTALGSFATLKRKAGSPFRSWNDRATRTDGTLPTFMTVAYQFMAACDLDGKNYRVATKRLMFFLEHWNPGWRERFSPRKNSPAAESFRATLMVAATSFGANVDLRPKFKSLGFPVDDRVFIQLTNEVGSYVESRP